MGYERQFMRQALKEAMKSYRKKETPVGCIIVKDGEVLARSHNLRELSQNPLAHAELIALEQASKKLGQWRLVDCEMYVTLEPCIMCTGAIIDARIRKVYIGARDLKRGAFSSYLKVIEDRLIPHNVEYEYVDTLSSYLLKRFFRELRQKKKEEKMRRCIEEQNRN